MINLSKNKIVLLLLLLIIVITFTVLAYFLAPLPPLDIARQMSRSDDAVSVNLSNWYYFNPKHITYDTGLIFYPGGKVDPLAYAPLLKEIAKNGILCVLTPMPFNLAILNSNEAKKVINTYSHIKKWYLVGHSLGGAMAARFVYNNPNLIDGLILLAAYPPADNALNDKNINVLSIYSQNDGLATPQKINNYKYLLPSNSLYYQIEGGNHSQFGYYGPQKGDGIAGISLEEQQRIIYEQMINFINLH